MTALHLSIVCGKMAVEKMQGISRLEQFVEALSEEERAKELKQEKKRQKRKNRRKNKCGFDSSEQEAEDKEKILDEVTLPGHSQGLRTGSPAPFTPPFCITEMFHLTRVVCCRVLPNLWPRARPVWVMRRRRRRKRPDVTTALP